MRANYHTHTWRCKHAEGTEREYVETAIAAGFEILGFSDHAPYPFPPDYDPYYRMFVDQTADYFQVLTALKQEYARDIEIHIGFEAEYYPRFFPALLDLLRDYPCEYLILGQHYIENEVDGVYTGRPSADPYLLTRYVDQVLEGLETGCYSYVAHPDILNWAGDEDLYRRETLRLCRGAKRLGIPLELNFAGLDAGRHYPSERFWQIAGQAGNQAVLGCDAHAPEELHKPQLEAQCRQIAKKFGLDLVETIDLRPVKG